MATAGEKGPRAARVENVDKTAEEAAVVPRYRVSKKKFDDLSKLLKEASVAGDAIDELEMDVEKVMKKVYGEEGLGETELEELKDERSEGVKHLREQREKAFGCMEEVRNGANKVGKMCLKRGVERVDAMKMIFTAVADAVGNEVAVAALVAAAPILLRWKDERQKKVMECLQGWVESVVDGLIARAFA
jgi:hypothetical protein